MWVSVVTCVVSVIGLNCILDSPDSFCDPQTACASAKETTLTPNTLIHTHQLTSSPFQQDLRLSGLLSAHSTHTRTHAHASNNSHMSPNVFHSLSVEKKTRPEAVRPAAPPRCQPTAHKHTHTQRNSHMSPIVSFFPVATTGPEAVRPAGLLCQSHLLGGPQQADLAYQLDPAVPARKRTAAADIFR